MDYLFELTAELRAKLALEINFHCTMATNFASAAGNSAKRNFTSVATYIVTAAGTLQKNEDGLTIFELQEMLANL